MRSFIYSWKETGFLPSKIIFLNSGVYLTTEGSPVLEELQHVEKEGLMPVLVASGIAEKYDMALVTGSGYSNNAIKSLLCVVDKQEEIIICVLGKPRGCTGGGTPGRKGKTAIKQALP